MREIPHLPVSSLLLCENGQISQTFHDVCGLYRTGIIPKHLFTLGYTAHDKESSDARVDPKFNIGEEVVAYHESTLGVEVVPGTLSVCKYLPFHSFLEGTA